MTSIEETQSETVNNKGFRMYAPETMKLTSSASERNVYVTYVCLINDIKPNEHMTPDYGPNKSSLHPMDIEGHEDPEEEPIQVERTRALHELIESPKKSGKIERPDSSSPYQTTTSEDSEQSEHEEDNPPGCDNPNILKLTKMKWLSEEQDGGQDSSSPSLSPTGSTTSSNCSHEYEGKADKHDSFGDRYLSTILRLDREHNMFGLSNIAIVGSRPSKKIKKEDDRAVFHQTAIVQICCGQGCCRHKSNTDLPTSLKCGGCRSCWDPFCSSCISSCGTPSCYSPPCGKLCSSCPKGKCTCKGCPPTRCVVDCSTCYGLKISLHKPQKYEPGPAELTPKSSCVLQKPVAARSCQHIPQCIPPSSCFPYLMPCFWPARPAAPCSIPAQCFHNPPCPAPRKPRPPPSPPDDSCQDKRGLCNNQSCAKNKK